MAKNSAAHLHFEPPCLISGSTTPQRSLVRSQRRNPRGREVTSAIAVVVLSISTIQECKPRSKPILVAINRLRPYPEGIQMEPSESSSGGQNPAGPETRRAEVEET